MMPRFAARASWAVLLLLNSACETLLARAQQPAVLTGPVAQSLPELNRVISEALNGAPVRLADDALRHDSVLTIERIQPRDAAGLPLNGRELGRPEHFQLVTRGPHCILIHERTGNSWTLRSATCTPTTAAR